MIDGLLFATFAALNVCKDQGSGFVLPMEFEPVFHINFRSKWTLLFQENTDELTRSISINPLDYE